MKKNCESISTHFISCYETKFHGFWIFTIGAGKENGKVYLHRKLLHFN
jgi:hypothetical protein